MHPQLIHSLFFFFFSGFKWRCGKRHLSPCLLLCNMEAFRCIARKVQLAAAGSRCALLPFKTWASWVYIPAIPGTNIRFHFPVRLCTSQWPLFMKGALKIADYSTGNNVWTNFCLSPKNVKLKYVKTSSDLNTDGVSVWPRGNNQSFICILYEYGTPCFTTDADHSWEISPNTMPRTPVKWQQLLGLPLTFHKNTAIKFKERVVIKVDS